MPETVTGEGRALADSLEYWIACLESPRIGTSEPSVWRAELCALVVKNRQIILTALRAAADPAREEDAADCGIPDESPDDAMDLVNQIEAAFQADGALSYAPDGTPCLTWSGRQAVGRVVAVDAADPVGRGSGEEVRVAEWQPASTAPTNRAIQVYIPHLDYYGNGGVYAGMLVDMGTGQRWMTFAWAMGRDMCGENRPTHWRDLPAPPHPETRAGGGEHA